MKNPFKGITEWLNKSSSPQLYAECDHWAVRKHAPILPAGDFPPPEWQNMPAFIKRETHMIDSVKTVKACPAISDFMNMGYVIPAWCDIEFVFDQANQTLQMRYSDPSYEIATHPPDQVRDFMSHKFGLAQSIKLDNPWRIWTKPGYSLMFLPMLYHTNRNWEAVPGVLDADAGQTEKPINIMIKRPESFMIKQGDPLVQLIPFKRENHTAETRATTQTGRDRHNAVCGMQTLSFRGWKKWVVDRKQYRVNSRDTDLPGSD